jgi:hypothetical protein
MNSDYQLFQNRDISGIINKYQKAIHKKSYQFYIKYLRNKAEDYQDAYQINLEITLKAIDYVFEKGLQIIDENFSFSSILMQYLVAYQKSYSAKKFLCSDFPVEFISFENLVEKCSQDIVSPSVVDIKNGAFEEKVHFQLDFTEFQDSLSNKEKEILKLLMQKQDRKEIAIALDMNSPELVTYYKKQICHKYYQFFKQAGYFN